MKSLLNLPFRSIHSDHAWYDPFNQGFPGGSDSKESTCSWETWVLIPGKGDGYPLQILQPAESRGQRSLESYSPWGCKELDTTEQLTHTHTHTHTRGQRSLVRHNWATNTHTGILTHIHDSFKWNELSIHVPKSLSEQLRIHHFLLYNWLIFISFYHLNLMFISILYLYFDSLLISLCSHLFH